MSNSNGKTNGEEYETGIPEYIKDLIENIAQQEGFKDHSVEWAAGSNLGDNFMGVMSSVLIKGYRNHKFDELPLMVKLPPQNAARRKLFRSAEAFTREIEVYEKLFPLYNKFQMEKGVKIFSKNGFSSYPKCYATVCDPEQDRYALIMEDLRQKGFVMFNKFNILDFEHCQIVVRELGKMHALSYALRDQRPDEFEPFKKMHDFFMQTTENDDKRVEFIANMVDKCIEALDPSELVVKDKLEQIKTSYLTDMQNCLGENVAEPFSVINHGDCWNNNMLYSYDKETKKPNATILVDFQLARFGSPVLDLLYFLFSSTTKKLRDDHYHDLIQIYYDTLASTMKTLGSDAEKSLTFNDMQDQFKRFGIYGVHTAVMLLQIITAEAKDLPDFDEISEKLENNTLKSFTMVSAKRNYAERVADVVRDCVQYGYI